MSAQHLTGQSRPVCLFLPFQRQFRARRGRHDTGGASSSPAGHARSRRHPVTHRPPPRAYRPPRRLRTAAGIRPGDPRGRGRRRRRGVARRDPAPGSRGQDQGSHRVQRGHRLGLRVRRDQVGWEAEVRRYRELLRRTVPLAVELRHEPSIAVWDGDEVVCACDRCSAVGYGDAADDVVGGALFEGECPNEKPPALTALAMMHASRSRWPSDSRGVA